MKAKILKQVIAERSNDYTLLEEKYKKSTGNSLLDPNIKPVEIKSIKPLTVSVVIPAYNTQSSILACLASIEQSSFNFYYQDRLQVIVADDGSTDSTWETIKNSRFSLNLTAIRQDRHSVAHARNIGLSVAEGDIIISCDADMVLSYYAIEHFMVRHQQLPNVLLVGFRKDTCKNDPRVDFNSIRKYGSFRTPCFTGDMRIVFPIPGYPSNSCLISKHFKRLGNARCLWMPEREVWDLPDLVFGALFSLPKHTYLNIGGYDERFYGWGHEDGYLAAEAIVAGQYIIPIYAASGLHIGHSPRSENKELEYRRNRKQYLRFLRTTKVGHHRDWLSLAKKRIMESFTYSPFPKTSQSVVNSGVNQEAEFTINEIDSLLAIGEYSRAFTILSKNEKLDKNGEYFSRLGKVFFGMNQYQRAIDIFKQTPAFTNLEADSMLNLAIAQVANNQFISAHSTLEKLSQTFPQMPDLSYWYNYSAQRHIRQGNNYFNQGFHKVARRCFEAALMLDPKNKTALEYREKCMLEE